MDLGISIPIYKLLPALHRSIYVVTLSVSVVSRFSGSTVVVHASAKVKSGAGPELQLPSMSLLTCKMSSQQFLLRVLKVIIQLRESARAAANKAKRSGWRLIIQSGVLPGKFCLSVMFINWKRIAKLSEFANRKNKFGLCGTFV